MIDINLQILMEREWEDVRKDFYYPQLPHPKLVDNIPNACIDIENLDIKVSEPFIKQFGEHDIEEKDALNEVLTHELTHFMKYPGSVLNTLRLQKAANDVDAEKASQLRAAFTETQTNVYMVNERNHPATVGMRRAVQPDENDGFGKLMYGLYQKVWEQDIGIKLSRKERKLVDRLSEIDFLDKEKELDNIREFVQILKDYQPKQKDGKQQSDGQGNYGQCQGSGVSMFSDNQIREGIRQFAQECDNPQEFEDIVKEVLSEGLGDEDGPKPTYGIKAGTDRGTTLLAGNFYSALAEKYAIPIRKKPIKKNGSLHPHSHTSFSVSDPINDMDPFSTPGILPGVTKRWKRKEGEVATSFEAVPNSVLVVDNSPSMFAVQGEKEIVSPSDRVYLHIVGATAISNAYLDNDSRVAVYSFGSSDHFTNFSKDKEQIHRELRRYSFDGGTVFTPQFLEGVLRQNEGEFDVSVISDMEISNLDSFVNTVLGIPKAHRVHLIYTNNDGGYVGSLRDKFGDQENVAILPLVQEKNIKQIVMGELKKSVR